MLLFLQLPRFPTLDQLWSNLAATRQTRRRFELDGLAYSTFYGINTAERFERELAALRLRERLLERKVAIEQARENARVHDALRWTGGERS